LNSLESARVSVEVARLLSHLKVKSLNSRRYRCALVLGIAW